MVGYTVPIMPSISAIKTKPVTMQRCTTVHMSGFRGGYPHVYTVASVIGSAFYPEIRIIFGTVCVAGLFLGQCVCVWLDGIGRPGCGPRAGPG